MSGLQKNITQLNMEITEIIKGKNMVQVRRILKRTFGVEQFSKLSNSDLARAKEILQREFFRAEENERYS